MMKQFIIVLFISLSISSFAQQTTIPHTEAVKTIDGTLTRMLQLLSIEKGEKIDTKSLEKLFLENATFSVRATDANYPYPFETVSLKDFLASLKDSYYESGFEEKEIGKVVNEFNGIANVFQSFEGSDSEGNTEKGMNSYQLVYLKNRWWIANMIWTFETDTVKIPKKYLQKGK